MGARVQCPLRQCSAVNDLRLGLQPSLSNRVPPRSLSGNRRLISRSFKRLNGRPVAFTRRSRALSACITDRNTFHRLHAGNLFNWVELLSLQPLEGLEVLNVLPDLVGRRNYSVTTEASSPLRQTERVQFKSESHSSIPRRRIPKRLETHPHT